MIFSKTGFGLLVCWPLTKKKLSMENTRKEKLIKSPLRVRSMMAKVPPDRSAAVRYEILWATDKIEAISEVSKATWLTITWNFSLASRRLACRGEERQGINFDVVAYLFQYHARRISLSQILLIMWKTPETWWLELLLQNRLPLS